MICLGLNLVKLSELILGKNMANDFVESVVCQEMDIPDNGMKLCDIGPEGGKVLLVKQGGIIHALGHMCSHYGAPLVNGVLGIGRIRCPWHGACFNIKSGDIEDFPGLDSLPCHAVEVDQSGGVKVKARKSDLLTNKRIKSMVPRDPNNNDVIIVIGGGVAGQVCAETLRQQGYTGHLVIVTAEKYLPYERIKLSKQLDIAFDNIQLRSEAFYQENGIEVLLNTKAIKLESKDKALHLNNETVIIFTSIFIATGSVPRALNLPGTELSNVFTLRSLDDAQKINNVIRSESKIVIYGTSFIGMEAGAYCISRCSSVTIIGRSLVPFQQTFGPEVGGRIAKLFSGKGVTLKMGKTISEIKGECKVECIVLSDGEVVPTDVLLLGLGSTFATNFLEGSGVELSPSGSILVNQFLETNCRGIFAGGDIAEAPVHTIEGNQRAAIGHWGLAHYHGRIAALNMVSKHIPLKTVPFFWTMLFGTSFRYAGYGAGYEETVSGGDLESLKYVCYYCKGDEVLAVMAVGADPVASAFAERLTADQSLKKTQVIANPLSWYRD